MREGKGGGGDEEGEGGGGDEEGEGEEIWREKVGHGRERRGEG